jgi:OOP family OmpA-OmpF porin
MVRKLLAITAAAVFLMGIPGRLVYAEVPLTINVGLGHWYFDEDRDINDTGTPWGSLEWAWNDHWATEILYAEDDTRADNGAFRADVTTWQLSMMYYGGSYIGEPWRVRPYAVLGGGEIDLDAGFADTVESTVNAGVGLRLMMTRRLGLRMEARSVWSLDEHDRDTLFSAGFSYYFGKVASDTPSTAASSGDTRVVGPTSAAAAGSAATAGRTVDDSDGDGVLNASDQCPDTAPGMRVDAVGCDLAVARVASIKMNVYFGFDSDVVEERYFRDIEELAEFLRRFDDVYVDVEGHTDSVGPDAYNQALSQRRAKAVVDLLVNQYGIAPRRLNPVGFGESQPMADNSTSEGRSQNRRVVATLQVEYDE